MTIERMDLCGLKCPEPQIKIAIKSRYMREGDILEAMSDCETFEADVRNWCKKVSKALLFVKDLGDGKILVQIRF